MGFHKTPKIALHSRIGVRQQPRHQSAAGHLTLFYKGLRKNEIETKTKQLFFLLFLKIYDTILNIFLAITILTCVAPFEAHFSHRFSAPLQFRTCF